jgi:hypothetical protein
MRRSTPRLSATAILLLTAADQRSRNSPEEELDSQLHYVRVGGWVCMCVCVCVCVCVCIHYILIYIHYMLFVFI